LLSQAFSEFAQRKIQERLNMIKRQRKSLMENLEKLYKKYRKSQAIQGK